MQIEEEQKQNAPYHPRTSLALLRYKAGLFHSNSQLSARSLARLQERNSYWSSRCWTKCTKRMPPSRLFSILPQLQYVPYCAKERVISHLKWEFERKLPLDSDTSTGSWRSGQIWSQRLLTLPRSLVRRLRWYQLLEDGTWQCCYCCSFRCTQICTARPCIRVLYCQRVWVDCLLIDFGLSSQQFHLRHCLQEDIISGFTCNLVVPSENCNRRSIYSVHMQRDIKGIMSFMEPWKYCTPTPILQIFRESF